MCVLLVSPGLVTLSTASATTPIFSDDFESGSLASWTGSSGMATQQQIILAGSWAARATTTGNFAYAYKTLGTTYMELYCRIFFDLLANSTTVALMRFRTPAAKAILMVGVNKSSELITYDPATAATTVGPAVTKGAWHELEVHVLIDAESSRQDVWLDGKSAAALSKIDQLGTSAIGRVDLGDSTSSRTFDVAFDEVAVDTSFIDTTAPSVPTGLAVPSFSNEEVDLSWDASSDNVGVAGYTIYRSDDGGLSYATIGTSPMTGYQDATASPSTTYSYSVDAFDAAGNHSAPSSPVTAITLEEPDTEAPGQPAGLDTTAVASNEVDLSWDASSDNVAVAGYTIYRSDDGGVPSDAIGSSTTTSYADETVLASTTYSYSVDAFDPAGTHSSPSAPITVTTPATTSVKVVASGDLATKASLDTTVSDFALTLSPDLAIILGDNHNLSKAAVCDESPCSAIDEYVELFATTWGRLPDIRPAPGNHDYVSDYGTDYMAYFGVPAYYSFDIPGWHIISLNTQLKNTTGSLDWTNERTWLDADLAQVPTTTSILAYWHQPLFSTSCHHPGQWAKAKPLWDTLLAHGAKTIVANAHTHVYERYEPMDSAGLPSTGGITQLTISSGGTPPASCFVSATPTPQVGDLGYHVALFTLRSDGTCQVDVYRVPPSEPPILIDQFDG